MSYITPTKGSVEPKEAAKPQSKEAPFNDERIEAVIARELKRTDLPIPQDAHEIEMDVMGVRFPLEECPPEILENIMAHGEVGDWVALKRTSDTLRALTSHDSKWKQPYLRSFGEVKPPDCKTYQEAHNRLETNLSRGIFTSQAMYHGQPLWFVVSEGMLIVPRDFTHDATTLMICDLEKRKVVEFVTLPSYFGGIWGLGIKATIKNGNIFAVYHNENLTRVQVWDSTLQHSLYTEISHQENAKLKAFEVEDQEILLGFENGRVCRCAIDFNESKITSKEVPLEIPKMNHGGAPTIFSQVMFSQGRIILCPEKPLADNSIRIFDSKTGKLEKEIQFGEEFINESEIEKWNPNYSLAFTEKYCAVVCESKKDTHTIRVFDFENKKWLESPIYESPRSLEIRIDDQKLFIRTFDNNEHAIHVFDLERLCRHPKNPKPLYAIKNPLREVESFDLGWFFDQGKHYFSLPDQIVEHDFTQPFGSTPPQKPPIHVPREEYDKVREKISAGSKAFFTE